MNFTIKNHRLHLDGQPVDYRLTPNRGGKINPIGVVMHHTASGILPGGDISWLTDKRARASAHLVIARDGKVTQLAPFNIKTWHAGKSRWKGVSNCNDRFIGIEVDNPGGLMPLADGRFSGVGGPYEAKDVVLASSPQHGTFKHWLAFPDEQLRAAMAVTVALWRHYGLTELVGHYDISPGRKTDIGPHFPMERLRGLCEGRDVLDPPADPRFDADARVVARGGLNVRRWPSIGSEKVGKYDDATLLQIIRSGTFSHDGEPQQWHLAVAGGLQGWVHADFVRLT